MKRSQPFHGTCAVLRHGLCRRPLKIATPRRQGHALLTQRSIALQRKSCNFSGASQKLCTIEPIPFKLKPSCRAWFFTSQKEVPRYRVERWMSGLSRTPGKRVWVNSPPRVRIPPAPPKIKALKKFKAFFLALRALRVPCPEWRCRHAVHCR